MQTISKSIIDSMTKLLAQKVLKTFGYQLTKYDPALPYRSVRKLLYFNRMFDKIAHVDGDIVECGLYKGHSFAMLVMLARDEGRNRQLWGFDSFEGWPEFSKEDNRPSKKLLNYASVESVNNLLRSTRIDETFTSKNVHVIKGFVEDTLPHYKGGKIALLHIDVDIYSAYLTCLKELYPQVEKGGVILFDEYDSKSDLEKWPGAKKAIDEFFGDKKTRIQHDKSGKYFLIKDE